MRKKIKKIIRNLAGAILILLGVLGLFLPFLQGFLLIFLGFGLLDFKGKKELVLKIKQTRLIRPIATWYDTKKDQLQAKYHQEKLQVKMKLRKSLRKRHRKIYLPKTILKH